MTQPFGSAASARAQAMPRAATTVSTRRSVVESELPAARRWRHRWRASRRMPSVYIRHRRNAAPRLSQPGQGRWGLGSTPPAALNALAERLETR